MAKAREAQEAKALESIEAMNEQHLKILRVVRGKAIEALKMMPLSSAMEAVRALEMTIKQERLVRGDGPKFSPSCQRAAPFGKQPCLPKSLFFDTKVHTPSQAVLL